MSLPQFLTSLFHEGRVQVENVFDRHGRLRVASPSELHDAGSAITAFERDYRTELSHQPPQLSVAAALWAAQFIHRACSLLTYRDVDEECVKRALSEKCPESPSPSATYSVDLTFRFLPDLARMARAASPEDPLVKILIARCTEWPMSSVGVTNVGNVDPAAFIEDPCLRQLYVDRILAEQDQTRLDDRRTRDAVQAAIGRHQTLAPRLAARLVPE